MDIIFIGFNYKSTPIEVRNIFSLNNDEARKLLFFFREDKKIQEAVVLSTCNRFELYLKLSSSIDEAEAYEHIYSYIMSIISDRDMEYEILSEINIKEFLVIYKGSYSVKHLFSVCSGLDSMIIGEDQILGQAKAAYEMSKEAKMTGKHLNTAFRYAITCAKRIKTDTDISRLSISVGTLALKIAKEHFLELSDKKLIIIGALGQIGSIVLKNALSLNFAKIWITNRSHRFDAALNKSEGFEIIDYKDRYKYFEEADVIISATMAPHYTVVAKNIERMSLGNKRRIYIDLAMPMDIDPKVAFLPDAFYYNIDNIKKYAKDNNDKKLLAVEKAGYIIEEYLDEYKSRILFLDNMERVEEVKKYILLDAKERSIEKALNSFFYRIKDIGKSQDLSGFLNSINSYLEDIKK